MNSFLTTVLSQCLACMFPAPLKKSVLNFAQKLSLLDPYAVIHVYLKQPFGDPVNATDRLIFPLRTFSKYRFSCILDHFCLFGRHSSIYLVRTILKSENHQPASIYRVCTIFKNEKTSGTQRMEREHNFEKWPFVRGVFF